MESTERQAYLYWNLLRTVKAIERLSDKGLVGDVVKRKAIHNTISRLGLEESADAMFDKEYVRFIKEQYGEDMESSPIPIFKAMSNAKKAVDIDPNYRGFTEIMAIHHSELTSSYALQSWLRSKSTVEFLSLWETANNSSFNSEGAAKLIDEMRESTSTLTLKKWITETGAKGIAALQGRYGGTYAHPIIALYFEMWLSPWVRLSVINASCGILE